jgi:drug/metabolite transporter (DMT)-like permease
MWLRLMLVAFVANGLGPFGLKMLVERSLAERFHYHYLAIWCAAGFLLALAAFLRLRKRPSPKECGFAALMGLASFGGQLCTSLSLEHGVPGHIAFPITTGGSLFVVAAGGRVLFHERIGAYGIAGIISGIAALVLLSG